MTQGANIAFRAARGLREPPAADKNVRSPAMHDFYTPLVQFLIQCRPHSDHYLVIR